MQFKYFFIIFSIDNIKFKTNKLITIYNILFNHIKV